MFSASAQRENNVWVFGDSCRIDFQDTLNPIISHINCYSFEASASISDKESNLLLFLNSPGYWTGDGFHGRIMNGFGEVVENGDSVNVDCSATNGALFLPIPGSNAQYYFFSITLLPVLNCCLEYSIVDMKLNNGHGKIITKNILLSSNVQEKLLAIKHGNGRDWWVITHRNFSNQFVKYLVTPDGISSPYIQSIGDTLVSVVSESSVTANGDKICLVSSDGHLSYYDFDRCSGQLSNWVQLGNPPFNSSNYYYGCEFSPDGKRLYVQRWDLAAGPEASSVIQYSTTALNPQNSMTCIFMNNQSPLSQMELGPDKKIYISCFAFDTSTNNLSVIVNPNDSSLLCNIQPYTISLDANNCFFGLPNMPHYNLGALSGSECDTISIDTITVKPDTAFSFMIFPIISNKEFQLSITGAKSCANVSVYNMLGQLVYDTLLTPDNYFIHHNLSLVNFSSQVYIVSVRVNNLILNQRIIKQ